MSELLPCPFCGGGCLYETRRNGYCDETPTMFCNSCKAVVTWEQVEEEGVNDETKAFVREHWNSRAERTCKCTTDDSAWCFVCSECGRSFPRNKLHLAHNHGEINYCPNCGCKVVCE